MNWFILNIFYAGSAATITELLDAVAKQPAVAISQLKYTDYKYVYMKELVTN